MLNDNAYLNWTHSPSQREKAGRNHIAVYIGSLGNYILACRVRGGSQRFKISSAYQKFEVNIMGTK